MKKIIVTGGSGKAGKATIRELLSHNYDVFNIDLKNRRKKIVPFYKQDLENFQDSINTISEINKKTDGIDGIIHQAAAMGMKSEPTFRINTVSTYNIFQISKILGIKNIVWASSETVLGLPFDTYPPYVPIDEKIPLSPESSYALSKILSEEMARQFCRRNIDMKIFGLRYSNIMEENDYKNFETFQKDPLKRKWNLWSYIDSRDVGLACRLAFESKQKGAQNFIITANDTVMGTSNKELLDSVFPGVIVKKKYSKHETLLSNQKAKNILGFEPQYSWRKLDK
tara:strand:- start:121 stop:969 length:849 start_codon:yes stop_codon:yes gene_type:complete